MLSWDGRKQREHNDLGEDETVNGGVLRPGRTTLSPARTSEGVRGRIAGDSRPVHAGLRHSDRTVASTAKPLVVMLTAASVVPRRYLFPS